MRKHIIAVSTISLITVLSVAHAQEKPMNHDGMDHSEMDHSKMDHSKMDHGAMEKGTTKTDGAAGTGVIHSIDTTKRIINLTHEPMPDLGWPVMTMDLPATKRVDLSGLKEGDKVDFKLKLGRDKKYRIIEIKMAK